MSKAVSIRSAVSSFLKSQGFERRVREADVFRLWGEIVGEVVAEAAKPARIEDGILLVKVENSVWRTELTYMGREIVEKIQRRVGKGVVKGIVFR